MAAPWLHRCRSRVNAAGKTTLASLASVRQAIVMIWALAIFFVVVSGVVAMLATMRAIGRAKDELSHDRLSVLFWALLAGLGVVLAGGFISPILANSDVGTDAGLVMVILTSLAPAFVTTVGLRNATILLLASRRRRRALGRGESIVARVVDRTRRLFAHDIMTVVVEADLPIDGPSTELAYRERDPQRTRVHRFVETCPSDHWARLEPGASVTLRYVPGASGCFAVELFPRKVLGT